MKVRYLAYLSVRMFPSQLTLKFNDHSNSIKGVGLDFSFFDVQKVTQCLIQPKVTLLLILLLPPPKG